MWSLIFSFGYCTQSEAEYEKIDYMLANVLDIDHLQAQLALSWAQVQVSNPWVDAGCAVKSGDCAYESSRLEFFARSQKLKLILLWNVNFGQIRSQELKRWCHCHDDSFSKRLEDLFRVQLHWSAVRPFVLVLLAASCARETLDFDGFESGRVFWT